MLSIGSTGEKVRQLQAGLNKMGYVLEFEDGTEGPLEEDGDFGEQTRMVVELFQSDMGLTVDGVVGTRTWNELFPPRDLPAPVGYDFTSRQGTITAIRAECARQGLGLPTQVAYVLATVEIETNYTFRPVRESYWMTEAWRQAHLRYWPYYGRGYVQLTWRRNYEHYAAKLALDLVNQPDLALEPRCALFILVDGFLYDDGMFTNHKLEDHVRVGKTDWFNARRCINGLNRAREIAALAEKWHKLIGG